MNDLTVNFLESRRGDSFYKELYHLNDSDNTVVRDESTGELFVRKTLKYYDVRVYDFLKKNSHANIPRIHMYYEVEGRLVVYEEFIAGRTLEYYINNNTDKAFLKSVVMTVCDALEFLHSANPTIIHRDIKPSNIMITNDGMVKLVDYDAAKVVNPESSRDTVLLGSEGFSAPEQYGFGSSDVRTDIFAMGKLISELFPNDKDYEVVITKATHIDPEKRYASISAFKRAFSNPKMSRFQFPGFRGDSHFHKIRSLIGYIFLLWLIDGVTLEGESQQGLIVYKVLILIMAIAWIDMLSGVSPIFTRFPLLRSKNIFIRIFGCAVYMFVSFFVVLILAGLIAPHFPD